MLIGSKEEKEGRGGGVMNIYKIFWSNASNKQQGFEFKNARAPEELLNLTWLGWARIIEQSKFPYLNFR